jgi:hypothetical protein
MSPKLLFKIHNLKTECKGVDSVLLYFSFLVDISQLEEELTKANSAILKISDICTPIQLGSYDDLDINITFFSASQEVRDILPLLHRIYGSVIFDKMWKKYAKKIPIQGNVPIDYIPENVWICAFEKSKKILQLFIDGTISLDKIDHTFGKFKQNYEQIKEEIRTLYMAVSGNKVDERLVEERVKQIKEYNLLINSKEAATLVLKIRDKFQLTGDFKMLELIDKEVCP